MPVMAIVKRKVFEDPTNTKPGERIPGRLLPWNFYDSTQPRIAAAVKHGDSVFLVTVRKEADGEKLWLVAQFTSMSKVKGRFKSSMQNTTPITDITHLRTQLRFGNGIGLSSVTGKLAQSLQKSRFLTER